MRKYVKKKYGENVSFPCFLFYGVFYVKKFHVTCKAAKPKRDKISRYYLFKNKFIKKIAKTNFTV